MPVRFQKRKKIAPGVRLNIGKKGVNSVTLGKRGAGVTVGKRGVHTNVGIPGTGVSYRTKIAGGVKNPQNKSTFIQNQQGHTEIGDTEVSTIPITVAFITTVVVFIIAWIVADFFGALFFALAVGFVVAVAGTIISNARNKTNNHDAMPTKPSQGKATVEFHGFDDNLTEIGAKANAHIWLEHAKMSSHALATTTKPVAFFSQFDSFIENATKLVSASKAGYITLVDSNIENALDEATHKRSEAIDHFINRAYTKTIENIEQIKTASAKQKRVEAFFATMQEYYDKMELSNIALLERLRDGHAEVYNEENKVVVADKHFDTMTGHEFEHFCADLLLKNGFTAEATSGSGDHGVDILAEKDGITYAIQCKRQSSNVGNKAVQEIYSGRTFYGKNIGAVLTNQYFTSSAKEAAERTGIVLWDRGQLEEWTDKE